MKTQVGHLTRTLGCFGLAVPLVLSGCQSAPQLTGTGATYTVSGNADDKDPTTGPPASYTVTGQSPGVGLDGTSYAFSIPVRFDQLTASSHASFGQRTVGTPNADTSDNTTSQFALNQRSANARITVSTSATVYLSSGAGASLSWDAKIMRPGATIVTSYAKEYRFRLKPGNANTIRVFTGPRGGTHLTEFPNGGVYTTIDAQPQSTRLVSGAYSLDLSLKTHSEGEQAVVISNVKVNL